MVQKIKRYLLLFLTIASMIGTLISGFLAFAHGNEYTLADALERDQVIAQIGGIAVDGRFLQPMLAITLTKQTALPLTVVIPQGLRLKSASDTADVVTLQEQKITLLLPFRQTTEVLAYSLDYMKSFPNSSSEYPFPPETAEISEELKQVLNNIVALQAEHELASQLAVWISHNNVELAEIDKALEPDLSGYGERVNDILQASDPPAPSLVDSSLWLAALILTLIFGTLYWKSVPPKRLIDQLTDWELLAKGGMAQVWAAEYKRSSKKVIVKFPQTNLEGKRINLRTIAERFENERTYHEMMDHENVVKLIESGLCNHPKTGRHTKYIILEFIDGETIYELICNHRYNQFRVDAIIEIVRQITNALTHIHQKEVVHRDITSKNIMVDQSGRVYLIDFGNAAEFDSKKTDTIGLQSVGTRPFYPRPHEKVGTFPAYDYYSLAILLYAMYSGKHVIGRSQEQVKEEIKKLYDENSSEAPMVVRKALAWYLDGKYSDNEEDSEQIRGEYFCLNRNSLAELVQGKENEPNQAKRGPIDSEPGKPKLGPIDATRKKSYREKHPPKSPLKRGVEHMTPLLRGVGDVLSRASGVTFSLSPIDSEPDLDDPNYETKPTEIK